MARERKKTSQSKRQALMTEVLLGNLAGFGIALGTCLTVSGIYFMIKYIQYHIEKGTW